MKANTGQCRPTAGPRGGFTHHHQPPTITTTATSPPAAPPAPPSPGLETHLGPLFRHSIRHHHHHWGLRHVSSLQFLFIYFILFYTSQGPRRVLGPCLFYFIFILFFLLHRDWDASQSVFFFFLLSYLLLHKGLGSEFKPKPGQWRKPVDVFGFLLFRMTSLILAAHIFFILMAQTR
jgi:hypothetical protein